MAPLLLQQNKSVKKSILRIIAALIVVAAVYAPAFDYFRRSWTADFQYSLAPVVPFICGYFVWQKWDEVKKLRREPSHRGIVLIILSLFLHITGIISGMHILSGISLYITLVGLCLFYHSESLVKTLWFPIAFAVFAIPVPSGMLNAIGSPLQLWASKTTASLLSVSGMEVTRSGVNLSVPGFDFRVAMACSGMSSLIALTGIAAIFAYTVSLGKLYKWVLFALAVPIALAANVIRITTIALVGHRFGAARATHIYHDWSSIFLFLTAILLLLGISRIMEAIEKYHSGCNQSSQTE